MIKIQSASRRTKKFKTFAVFVFIFSCFVLPVRAEEVPVNSISALPASGTFVVGSTFDVALYLNTGGEYVNALEVFLEFSPDKLQLVSPTAGSSIVEIWTSQPRYDNQRGIIELRGGIPKGINVSQGLITNLTFRVKSTGVASLRFTDETKIYLNDGRGTDMLAQTNNGVYTLVLPPPAGPLAVSETHPDQSKWYPNATALLTWASEQGVEGYSYILNEQAVDIPDDISEGARNSVAYKNLADGIHYFHIKSLREGRWGGVTHYALQIDATPPAQFPIEFSPSKKTTERQPVARFQTTDAHSGLSHYEIQGVPLDPSNQSLTEDGQKSFFIEAQSPFLLPPLDIGSYDIIVRAYDNAGNFIDVTERLKITNAFFQFVEGKGLEVKNAFTIPWFVIWANLIGVILLLGFIGWRLRRWHERLDVRRGTGELPGNVSSKLKELQEYQKKYGKIISMVILMVGILLCLARPVAAQELGLTPPFVTTISKNISNEEIFYVGGKTDEADIEIIVYLQNLRTGETTSRNVLSDRRGDWFYRHDAFLSSGEYVLWAQSKLGAEVSPPGPQIPLSVQQTALQFGASRISFEVLYLLISAFLLLLLLGVGWYTLVHARHARRKHKEFMKELQEAEESIRRGFAVLRRDIQAEIAVIKKAKLNKELSMEEKAREEELLRDLNWAEQYIGK
mgnify:FL=1